MTPRVNSAPSEVNSRRSAANALPHPSAAQNGQKCALSDSRLAALREELKQARPVGCVSRIVAEAARHARCKAAAGELQTSVKAIFERAQSEEWSTRELARRSGIAERTLRRLRNGQANPLTWLPKIQTAANRVGAPSYA
jgi:transcriptional regulator with XRE-family HTH domain